MTQPRRSEGLGLLLDESRAEAAEWRHHLAERSPESRMLLFDRHTAFARRIARAEWQKIGELGLSRDDCEQFAFEALLHAIDRYDPQAGVPFTAFARLRIRGAIRNGLAKATEATALYSARRRIERDRMRSIREQASASEGEPLELLRELAVGLALGFMLQEAGEAGLDKMAAADPSAYDAASWRQLVEQLGKRLAALPERERLILEYHYRQDIQFTEIAKLLGVSKGRISQLHGQAIKRLRASLSKFR